MSTIWKPIPGMDGYEASSTGLVRQINEDEGWGRIVDGTPNTKQPEYLHLGGTTIYRHIYAAFHGLIPKGMEIDHIDHDPTNNRPENLRVVTRQENMAKSWAKRRAEGKTAMHKLDRHCKRGHEYTEENTWINGNGYRFCRACARIRYQMKKAKSSGMCGA